MTSSNTLSNDKPSLWSSPWPFGRRRKGVEASILTRTTKFSGGSYRPPLKRLHHMPRSAGHGYQPPSTRISRLKAWRSTLTMRDSYISYDDELDTPPSSWGSSPGRSSHYEKKLAKSHSIAAFGVAEQDFTLIPDRGPPPVPEALPVFLGPRSYGPLSVDSGEHLGGAWVAELERLQAKQEIQRRPDGLAKTMVRLQMSSSAEKSDEDVQAARRPSCPPARPPRPRSFSIPLRATPATLRQPNDDSISKTPSRRMKRHKRPPPLNLAPPPLRIRAASSSPTLTNRVTRTHRHFENIPPPRLSRPRSPQQMDKSASRRSSRSRSRLSLKQLYGPPPSSPPTTPLPPLPVLGDDGRPESIEFLCRGLHDLVAEIYDIAIGDVAHEARRDDVLSSPTSPLSPRSTFSALPVSAGSSTLRTSEGVLPAGRRRRGAVSPASIYTSDSLLAVSGHNASAVPLPLTPNRSAKRQGPLYERCTVGVCKGDGHRSSTEELVKVDSAVSSHGDELVKKMGKLSEKGWWRWRVQG